MEFMRALNSYNAIGIFKFMGGEFPGFFLNVQVGRHPSHGLNGLKAMRHLVDHVHVDAVPVCPYLPVALIFPVESMSTPSRSNNIALQVIVFCRIVS
jgi:hypothetical protein